MQNTEAAIDRCSEKKVLWIVIGYIEPIKVQQHNKPGSILSPGVVLVLFSFVCCHTKLHNYPHDVAQFNFKKILWDRFSLYSATKFKSLQTIY